MRKSPAKKSLGDAANPQTPEILAANGRGWTQMLETVDYAAPLDFGVLEVD